MYKLGKPLEGQTETIKVILIEDGSSIPFDQANTDYQEYLKWVAEGNEPLPADEA